MSSEKSMFMPAAELSSVASTSVPKAEKLHKAPRRLSRWRVYTIPLLISLGFHLTLAYWPVPHVRKEVLPTAYSAAVSVIQLQSAEAERASSSAEPSATPAEHEESPSLVPPALPEPAFEIAAMLRQQLGDYAHSQRGAFHPSALAIPAPRLAGDLFGRPGESALAGANSFTPEPPYPPAARQEGREGVVELEVVILPSGRVHAAQVAQSSGHADLDRAARETVLAKWRFPSGQTGEQFVRVSFRLTANARRR